MWRKVQEWLKGLTVAKLSAMTPLVAAVVTKNIEDMETRVVPLIDFGNNDSAGADELADAAREGEGDDATGEAIKAEVDTGFEEGATAVATAADGSGDDHDFEGAIPLDDADLLLQDCVPTADDCAVLLWLSELEIVFGLSRYPLILGTNGGCFAAEGKSGMASSSQPAYLPNEGPSMNLTCELDDGMHNDDLDAGKVEADRQHRQQRKDEAAAERKRLAERKSWDVEADELDDCPSAEAEAEASDHVQGSDAENNEEGEDTGGADKIVISEISDSE
jgi:hypothetical protein